MTSSAGPAGGRIEFQDMNTDDLMDTITELLAKCGLKVIANN
jgi:hypothetical protein